ncbi:hypothetical protein B0H17DRAFT_1147327 [Mycena rosella]|uniref:Uncharacterized protein n=1 Tax=Mycena rosella TaxID=1033263 RepID=A0AAD7CLX4_MYCRO|nr:hypothetical protein B0H17DRAFT_1147327 [Mycena rosella]
MLREIPTASSSGLRVVHDEREYTAIPVNIVDLRSLSLALCNLRGKKARTKAGFQSPCSYLLSLPAFSWRPQTSTKPGVLLTPWIQIADFRPIPRLPGASSNPMKPLANHGEPTPNLTRPVAFHIPTRIRGRHLLGIGKKLGTVSLYIIFGTPVITDHGRWEILSRLAARPTRFDVQTTDYDLRASSPPVRSAPPLLRGCTVQTPTICFRNNGPPRKKIEQGILPRKEPVDLKLRFPISPVHHNVSFNGRNMWGIQDRVGDKCSIF